MMSRLIVPFATIACAALASAALSKPLPDSANSPSFSGHRLARQASISLAAARSIALKARPGAITDEELEHERGGTGLRYSFDVKSGSVTYEVGVDAKTGKVLEDGLDTDRD